MPEYLEGYCTECGVDITYIMRQTHNNFHANIDEIVDWARSVSDIFVQKASTGPKLWEPTIEQIEANEGISCARIEGYSRDGEMDDEST